MALLYTKKWLFHYNKYNKYNKGGIKMSAVYLYITGVKLTAVEIRLYCLRSRELSREVGTY